MDGQVSDKRTEPSILLPGVDLEGLGMLGVPGTVLVCLNVSTCEHGAAGLEMHVPCSQCVGEYGTHLSLPSYTTIDSRRMQETVDVDVDLRDGLLKCLEQQHFGGVLS